MFLFFLSIDEKNGKEKEQQQSNDLSSVNRVVDNVNLVETASIIIPNESKSLSNWSCLNIYIQSTGILF